MNRVCSYEDDGTNYGAIGGGVVTLAVVIVIVIIVVCICRRKRQQEQQRQQRPPAVFTTPATGTLTLWVVLKNETEYIEKRMGS